jgi:hypothetical protein
MNAGNDTYQPRTAPERRRLNRGEKIAAEMAATTNKIKAEHNAVLGTTGGNAGLISMGYQPQTNILKQFQEGRDYYIQEMQKAIFGQPSEFSQTPLGYTSNVVSVSENDGTELISEMGVNHPYDRALVRSQDKNIASMMLFPGTDMLAYSRSIEYPHATSHTATFGF